MSEKKLEKEYLIEKYKANVNEFGLVASAIVRLKDKPLLSIEDRLELNFNLSKLKRIQKEGDILAEKLFPLLD